MPTATGSTVAESGLATVAGATRSLSNATGLSPVAVELACNENGRPGAIEGCRG